jgi:hypothetical protein
MSPHQPDLTLALVPTAWAALPDGLTTLAQTSGTNVPALRRAWQRHRARRFLLDAQAQGAALLQTADPLAAVAELPPDQHARLVLHLQAGLVREHLRLRIGREDVTQWRDAFGDAAYRWACLDAKAQTPPGLWGQATNWPATHATAVEVIEAARNHTGVLLAAAATTAGAALQRRLALRPEWLDPLQAQPNRPQARPAAAREWVLTVAAGLGPA